jgi:hypothetical protein
MTEDNQKRLSIDSVKNSDRDITAITTDPEAVHFNMDSSKFHLIFRAANWARKTPVWSDIDFFVIVNNQQKAIIRAIHAAVRKAMQIKPEFKRFPTDIYNDWRQKVVVWWNDIVENGHSTKMPQLYLYGASNVGKTSFIRELLS